eukprot:CAMPEP_0175132916 /NCGR_PEP_ID=MMETSP0087-20121206/7338_1 /TAXON_ID=136419 /ORGANISM="Unknown Unknown, Strain D1" /LENGTH=204 /DNA_ID=CAMNT_0016415319 /DNA_START=69 /DNA_END=680 /DNA_ORIENTATION=-
MTASWGHDETKHAIVYTTQRIIQIEEKKIVQEVALNDPDNSMQDVIMADRGALRYYSLTVVMERGDHQKEFLVSTFEGAQFFYELLKQQILATKVERGAKGSLIHRLSSQGAVIRPKHVNGASEDMAKILQSLQKHRRLQLLPGEKLVYHTANMLGKAKISLHPHLSTSNCVMMTTMRLIKIEDSVVTHCVFLHELLGVEHQPH